MIPDNEALPVLFRATGEEYEASFQEKREWALRNKATIAEIDCGRCRRWSAAYDEIYEKLGAMELSGRNPDALLDTLRDFDTDRYASALLIFNGAEQLLRGNEPGALNVLFRVIKAAGAFWDDGGWRDGKEFDLRAMFVLSQPDSRYLSLPTLRQLTRDGSD